MGAVCESHRRASQDALRQLLDLAAKKLNVSATKNLIGRVNRLVAEETIQLHGTKLPGTSFGVGMFERGPDGSWKPAKSGDHAGKLHKHPERSGPFRQAWRNRFVLVYGTQGKKPETAALFQQARFDALHCSCKRVFVCQ